MAVKLALCKAREKEWKKIRIKIKQKQLLKMIQTINSKDMAMHSHLEDIRNLCSMFMECSFILSTNLTGERVDLVSMHALSISFDEGWLHSQCQDALVKSIWAFAQQLYSLQHINEII